MTRHWAKDYDALHLIGARSLSQVPSTSIIKASLVLDFRRLTYGGFLKWIPNLWLVYGGKSY
jgi:hypothetical protein